MANKDIIDSNAQPVLSAFEQFLSQVQSSGRFAATELKNFMEPVFAQNGYRTIRTNENGNILIIASAALGDFVCMSAMIREMRRVYETAHITLALDRKLLDIAEFCPYIDEIVYHKSEYDINDFAAMYRANLHLAEGLLSRVYDVAYYFAFGYDTDAGLLAYMSGARRVVCPKLVRGGWYDVFLPLCTQTINSAGYHRRDNCLSVLDEALGAPVLHRALEFWTAPQDLPTVRDMLPRRRFIALCLGGSAPRKHYPPEKYARAVETILRGEEADFVVLGGPKDTVDAEVMKKSLSDVSRVHFFVGQLKLRQIGAVLSMCEYCITNDTSLAHIAAAVKVPTADIFPCSVPTMRYLCGMGIVPAVLACYPVDVPAVVVQPRQALPDCDKDPQTFHGCNAAEPHCISQIEPETVVNAFRILKELTAKNIRKPCYYSGGDTYTVSNAP